MTFYTPKDNTYIQKLSQQVSQSGINGDCEDCLKLKESIRMRIVAKADYSKSGQEVWEERVVDHIRCEKCTDKLTTGIKWWQRCPNCKEDWSALLWQGHPNKDGKGMCPRCVDKFAEENRRLEVPKQAEKTNKPYWQQ